MQIENQKRFAIVVYLLIGIVGLPAGIYQLILAKRADWVCYSKHGHVLEAVTACEFNLFSGIAVSVAAVTIGLYQALKRG